jgi:hypothetical protein
MIALTLSFFDDTGARFTIKDWLVHSDNRWSEKKCYDFANACGLSAQYAAGTMHADDCLGRSGFAMVGVEKGKPKQDGTGNFPDRNSVRYYTAKPAPKAAEHFVDGNKMVGAAPATAPAAAEAPGEDVPF